MVEGEQRRLLIWARAQEMTMAVVLHHHPFSRAATVVWMLEEVGVPYELSFVDLKSGEQKAAEHRALNGMGKLPVLVDDGVVVSETAAIGMYLADRYALGRLAPLPDHDDRGAYLRWCVFGPSVIEPACLAKGIGFTYGAGQAGFGTYDEMLDTVESGLRGGPWLLGAQFSMADVLIGATLRWMIGFNMMEARPAFTEYVARRDARPARQAAFARNAQVVEERGLKR